MKVPVGGHGFCPLVATKLPTLVIGSSRHAPVCCPPRPAVGVPPGVRLAVLTRPDEPQEGHLKSDEEIMEILEAFDLTGSLRAAAELAGCSHHTVARLVAE